jgi:hypothetical protein
MLHAHRECLNRHAFLGAIALSILALVLPAAVRAADFSTAGTWACAATGEGPNGDKTGKFTLVITESGSDITGSYYNGTASLKGQRSGNTITGTFTEPSGSGVFTFTFSGDGQSFTGTWGTKSGQTGGTWSGTRQ